MTVHHLKFSGQDTATVADERPTRIRFTDWQAPRNMWLHMNKDTVNIQSEGWSKETGETVWTYVLNARGLAKMEAAGFSADEPTDWLAVAKFIVAPFAVGGAI